MSLDGPQAEPSRWACSRRPTPERRPPGRTAT